MGKNNFFQFKQFRITQERSAMKVGVDGVLLGAWTDVQNCSRILDVGTGTGLIALMLAQRSNAQITAVEIEKNAADEAAENISVSPWKERVEVRNSSFQEFAASTDEKFDLIVSNPPFFSKSLPASNTERSLARHNHALSFTDLIQLSSKLLSTEGRISVVLPVNAFGEISEIAARDLLYLQRMTEVNPKSEKSVTRILAEWGKTETAPVKDCITVYKDEDLFSDSYVKLTREFYLKF
ncbi:tRNA1(Val) (adenine(37)-N6)-methyltransferase [Maribellus mangrovi]|uniref:tRNA1(Val) (adenine(37)-N6)-methyltransferase n=1 Tax=Maribellus mangrovi TaxID=3133146 RepID=UPI0030EF7E50